MGEGRGIDRRARLLGLAKSKRDLVGIVDRTNSPTDAKREAVRAGYSDNLAEACRLLAQEKKKNPGQYQTWINKKWPDIVAERK